jgi:hypothetical protein
MSDEGRPVGQLERGLVGLTIDIHREKDQRTRKLDEVAGHEIEQQIRAPISGTAGTDWTFIDRGYGFLYPFVWRPMQRGAPFKTPHFSYGIEHVTGSDELVLVQAAIVKWNINTSSLVVGARVRFSAQAPNASLVPASFSAVVHLTFQGWAGETEEGEVV